MYAIVFSAALHGLLFLSIPYFHPKASSKGSQHVILLEEQTRKHATKQTSVTQTEPPLPQTANKTHSPPTTETIEEPKITQNTKAQPPQVAMQSTGSTIKQNAQSDTPTDEYRHTLIQHLLAHMGPSPSLGKVDIHASIMQAGIMYQVKIEQVRGNEQYRKWVESKVLNANPYPPLPNNITQRPLRITFSVSHEASEPSN